MTLALQLALMEKIVSYLPPDEQAKVKMARESLRKMIEIDRGPMTLAIQLEALSASLETRKHFAL